MINYDNYTYNENCVFKKQCLKERLEKQLGDFGEQLVMTLLGRIAKYSVAYVDHEGADLIATKGTDSNDNDKEKGRGYAISVKAAQIGPSENETKVFIDTDQKKLCVFAKDFNLIPTVAMVFIPKDFAFIDVYLITLDAFVKLANREDNEIEKEAIKLVKNGLQINNFSLGTSERDIKHSDKRGYLNYLQSSELIEHIRLDVRNRDNFSQGIRQVAEDGSDDIECREKLSKGLFKDGNLSRQLGDAGEYLLTMFLGQQKKYKVARVDHVGADLIAADKDGKKYAISVKTLQSKSYEFYEYYINDNSVKNPKRELGKLQDFSDKYEMIAVVACIFIKDNFKGMDIYISSLDNWIKGACKESNKAVCFTYTDNKKETPADTAKWLKTINTFKINIGKPEYMEYISAMEGMEHIEIDFLSAFEQDKKWK